MRSKIEKIKKLDDDLDGLLTFSAVVLAGIIGIIAGVIFASTHTGTNQ